MTALTRYQRLECPGVWHQSPDSQRRDVTVALGDATLILKDRAEMALTHWSLAAVERVNPGTEPALFAPGPEDDERLEVEDPHMIAALETVRKAVARGNARRGRLRRWGTAATLSALVLALVLWVPQALVAHTARALPDSSRQEIGRRMVLALEPHMGRPCRDLAGRQALETLRQRLFPEGPWQVRLLEAGPGVVALPGHLLVAGAETLGLPGGPDALAGHLLAAATRAEAEDRIVWMLERAGAGAALQLLTTGEIADEVLEDAAAGLVLGDDLHSRAPEPLLQRFAEAQVTARPYGLTANASGGTWTPMIEGDPWPAGSPEPVLSDAAWLQLEGICD